jgi:hypothetical protein
MFYMLCHSYPFKDRELLAYTQGAPFPSAHLSLHNVTRKAHAIMMLLPGHPLGPLSETNGLLDSKKNPERRRRRLYLQARVRYQAILLPQFRREVGL